MKIYILLLRVFSNHFQSLVDPINGAGPSFLSENISPSVVNYSSSDSTDSES